MLQDAGLCTACRCPCRVCCPLPVAQVSATGVTYGLRFTAYFPCAAGQGRYEVLDATIHQPGPTHVAAFGPKELNPVPLNSSAGIGWGADVGIASRVRLQGAHSSTATGHMYTAETCCCPFRWRI